jgi:hypothetical protein
MNNKIDIGNGASWEVRSGGWYEVPSGDPNYDTDPRPLTPAEVERAERGLGPELPDDYVPPWANKDPKYEDANRFVVAMHNAGLIDATKLDREMAVEHAKLDDGPEAPACSFARPDRADEPCFGSVRPIFGAAPTGERVTALAREGHACRWTVESSGFSERESAALVADAERDRLVTISHMQGAGAARRIAEAIRGGDRSAEKEQADRVWCGIFLRGVPELDIVTAEARAEAAVEALKERGLVNAMHDVLMGRSSQ